LLEKIVQNTNTMSNALMQLAQNKNFQAQSHPPDNKRSTNIEDNRIDSSNDSNIPFPLITTRQQEHEATRPSANNQVNFNEFKDKFESYLNSKLSDAEKQMRYDDLRTIRTSLVVAIEKKMMNFCNGNNQIFRDFKTRFLGQRRAKKCRKKVKILIH
jgi:hypothetical protein